MKGLKKKSVDTQKVEEDKFKKTSHVSEFSEEEDDNDLQTIETLGEDYFEKSQGETNESKKRISNVREDGRRERGHDEGQEDHVKKSEVGRKEEASSEKESKEEKEVTTFKHGIPKEISVFVTAKVTTLPYENIDISTGITLTLPPNATVDITTSTREEAFEYCSQFIQEKVAEIRKAVSSKK